MQTKLPDFRSPEFLLGHIRHTLSFYAGRCLDASGGFFHFFKDDGSVYDRRTRHLVSSTRFVFNHAMAYRRFGGEDNQRAARHGLAFLQQAHAQPQGGYAWQIDWIDGRATVQDGTNHCYGLAFVLLAHAHALMAGIEEASAGLAATFELMEARFWEPAHQLYADEASADWQLGAYRGQNANMHACEAMMAAFEATGDARYLQRALILATSIAQCRADLAGGLVWEHYHADWSIDWDYNRGDKANIFRPWGHQTGHLTEWAKLLLQLESFLPQTERPDWLLPRARHFFDTAMARGWDATHGGLVYALAPDATVCDADKYFWVQAESLAAAALLARRTSERRQGRASPARPPWGFEQSGKATLTCENPQADDIRRPPPKGDEQSGRATFAREPTYWEAYDKLWAYSWEHMIDHRHGAWYRIRTPDNRAYSDEKSPAGKTDYHTMGACYDVLRALGSPQPNLARRRRTA